MHSSKNSSQRLEGVIWYHRDLRISDHEGLRTALSSGGRWEAIVIPSANPNSPQGQFITECQTEIEASLRFFEIALHRIPEHEVADWIRSRQDENPELILLTQRRYNARDQSMLFKATADFRADKIRIFDEGTLYLEQDLPFSIETLPGTFTPFQKKIRASRAPIREPIHSVPSTAELLSPGRPTHEIGGSDAPVTLKGRTFQFKGGERNAQARLHEYLFQTRAALHYHETRNGLLELNDSSKLSPYLAQGCISARQVHAEIRKLQEKTGPSQGLEGLIYELEWRDYFKYLSLRSGDRLFWPQGLRNEARESSPDRELFTRWCAGETGNDFIDANLLELKTSGWMSNRGRQNVASFLAKTLKLPWLWGAEWFEKNLMDFDVETNQGNWMYLAGVGTDPRDRVFNPDVQAENYDGNGAYRTRWST